MIIKVDPELLLSAEKWLRNFQDGNQKVCKIQKPIYGLRQSGRQWKESGQEEDKKLDSELKNLGLMPLQADQCLYIHKNEEGTTIIAVYVDDLTIATNDMEQMR